MLHIGSGGATLDVDHLPIGGSFDDFQIALESFQRQQPIEIGRLVLRRNAEPLVVGIEVCSHGSLELSPRGSEIAIRANLLQPGVVGFKAPCTYQPQPSILIAGRWLLQPLFWRICESPPMELKILLADARLIVADKPSGLLSVPGRGADKQDSLWSRLQAEWENLYVVHRIDRDTSGVVLFARDPEALRELARQFQERTTEKRYLALVSSKNVTNWVAGTGAEPPARRSPGTPDAQFLLNEMLAEQGRITLPLARDLDQPPRYRVDYQRGLTAVTDFQVVKRDAMHTRVELTPQTGRSHQLRVHLREFGHPILGDPLYAPATVEAMAPRLCLHAMSLEVTHPDGGRRRFESPVPF